MPVNVSGVKQLQKAMKAVEPNLNMQMSKDIKAVMLIVRDKARGYLPGQNEVLSGWAKGTASIGTINYRAFPAYDYALAKSKVQYSAGQNKTNRSGFKAAFYVYNNSAPGAIFETAGRKHPDGDPASESLNPKAGIHFIQSAQNLSPLKGSGMERGRAIYRAWYEDQGKVYGAVLDAITTVANKFNAGQLKKVA